MSKFKFLIIVLCITSILSCRIMSKGKTSDMPLKKSEKNKWMNRLDSCQKLAMQMLENDRQIKRFINDFKLSISTEDLSNLKLMSCITYSLNIDTSFNQTINTEKIEKGLRIDTTKGSYYAIKDNKIAFSIICNFENSNWNKKGYGLPFPEVSNKIINNYNANNIQPAELEIYFANSRIWTCIIFYDGTQYMYIKGDGNTSPLSDIISDLTAKIKRIQKYPKSISPADIPM